MAQCEILWVKTKNEAGKVVECWINASDFDKSKHEKAPEPKAKKAEKVG